MIVGADRATALTVEMAVVGCEVDADWHEQHAGGEEKDLQGWRALGIDVADDGAYRMMR